MNVLRKYLSWKNRRFVLTVVRLCIIDEISCTAQGAQVSRNTALRYNSWMETLRTVVKDSRNVVSRPRTTILSTVTKFTTVYCSYQFLWESFQSHFSCISLFCSFCLTELQGILLSFLLHTFLFGDILYLVHICAALWLLCINCCI